MIPIVNCLTSFFAGFVVFAYMGYISEITGQNIDNIIEAGIRNHHYQYFTIIFLFKVEFIIYKGQGLAFVVYPYAGK